MLPNDKKAMIAGELDRSVREIERKISVREFLLSQIATRYANINIGYANKSSVLSFSSVHFLQSPFR